MDTAYSAPWSDAVLAEKLRCGDVGPFPARMRLREGDARGVLEIRFGDATAHFAYVYKNRSAPKALEQAVAEASRAAKTARLSPLVIVPYLPEESLRHLEEAGMSAFDLCGNGVIRAPGMAIWRGGHPNRFRESQPVRNVYRGSSALFARAFLLRPVFPSLTALRAFVLDRFLPAAGVSKESRLAKSTASKAARVLEEERVIVRSGTGLSLLSPALLLRNLRQNYARPRGRRVEGKTTLPPSEAWSLLRGAGMRAVATGDGSAGRYGLLSGAARLSLYVDDFEKAQTLLRITPGRVFPNIEIVEEAGDAVYFDARTDGASDWASPVQAYVELSNSGPREKEAAQVLEALFLKGETF